MFIIERVMQINSPESNTKNPTTEKALFSDAETEHYLGLGKGKLRRSRHAGYLFEGVSCPPHVRLGRRIYYRKQDLEKWLEQFTTYQATAQAKAETMKRTRSISADN